MRGALCTDEIAYVIYGIIPAYAGSTPVYGWGSID